MGIAVFDQQGFPAVCHISSDVNIGMIAIHIVSILVFFIQAILAVETVFRMFIVIVHSDILLSAFRRDRIDAVRLCPEGTGL